MKKLNSILFALVLSAGVMADSTDNEIFLQQTGDNLTLTIDQQGYANKFGGTIVSGAVATDMMITGSNVTLNLDQIGNSNQLFGPIVLDQSQMDMSFTGDSNIFDWNIGYGGSADSLDMDLAVTGSSNTWNFDLAYNAAAESVDYDGIILGSSNVFTTIIDSGNTKWELDLTGSGNDYNTTQKDADQILIVDYTGDDGNVDIIQQSGTCPTGVSSCSGKIDLQVDSDDAVITINQKDTSD